MVAENNEVKVPKRILNTLLASLTAGVVPRSGAPYIAIGRKEEIGIGTNKPSVKSIASYKLNKKAFSATVSTYKKTAKRTPVSYCIEIIK